MGAPLVGMAAERWFGFSGIAANTADCPDPGNAHASLHFPQMYDIPALYGIGPSLIDPTNMPSISAYTLSVFNASMEEKIKQQTAFSGVGALVEVHSSSADLSKAEALGSAMAIMMMLPWTLCAILYSGLHWSYPRDKRRAAAAAALFPESAAAIATAASFIE